MTTATTSTATAPFQRPADPPRRGRRSWWTAAAAVSVTVATMGVVLTLAGSSTDRPASVQVPASTGTLAPSDHIGITSADAAERRIGAAQATAIERCAGLSVDAAERCMSAG